LGVPGAGAVEAVAGMAEVGKAGTPAGAIARRRADMGITDRHRVFLRCHRV